MRARTRTTAAAIGGLLVGGLLLVGCGDSDGTPTSDPEASTDGDLDLDLDDGDVSIDLESPEGSASLGIGTDLPDGFPDAVFLPEGFEVVNATEQERDGRTSILVNANVAGDIAGVVASIRDSYEVEPSDLTEGDAFSTVRYADVEGFEVEYTLTTNADGATVLTLGVYPNGG